MLRMFPRDFNTLLGRFWTASRINFMGVYRQRDWKIWLAFLSFTFLFKTLCSNANHLLKILFSHGGLEEKKPPKPLCLPCHKNGFGFFCLFFFLNHTLDFRVIEWCSEIWCWLWGLEDGLCCPSGLTVSTQSQTDGSRCLKHCLMSYLRAQPARQELKCLKCRIQPCLTVALGQWLRCEVFRDVMESSKYCKVFLLLCWGFEGSVLPAVFSIRL